MTTLTERLEALAFDAEHETTDGLITNSPCLTLADALKAVEQAKAAAFKSAAKFITDDANKWRPVDPSVAEAMDTLASDLTKHARRVRKAAR